MTPKDAIVAYLKEKQWHAIREEQDLRLILIVLFKDGQYIYLYDHLASFAENGSIICVPYSDPTLLDRIDSLDEHLSNQILTNPS